MEFYRKLGPSGLWCPEVNRILLNKFKAFDRDGNGRNRACSYEDLGVWRSICFKINGEFLIISTIKLLVRETKSNFWKSISHLTRKKFDWGFDERNDPFSSREKRVHERRWTNTESTLSNLRITRCLKQTRKTITFTLIEFELLNI